MHVKSQVARLLITVLLAAGLVVFAGCGPRANPAGNTPPESVQTEKSPVTDQQAPEKTKPDQIEVIINGGFEKGIDGWVLASGRIKSEEGNKYLRVGNNWQNYQLLKVEPNTVYTFNASTRKEHGDREARFKLIFFDNHAQRLGYVSILYNQLTDGWENIPPQEVKVPAGTEETILYLLANGEKDTYDFDNISLVKVKTEADPIPGKKTTVTLNASPERIRNGSFSFSSGWSGLDGKIKTADNGNKYLVNGYNWDVRQCFSVSPNTEYKFNARTKKGTAKGAARFVIAFFNEKGQRMPNGYNFSYIHQAQEWENIPTETINVPSEADKAAVYLLSNDPANATHDFDDISLIQSK